MYKDGTKPEEVQVFIDEAEFVGGSAKALASIGEKKPKLIKDRTRECPYDNNIAIKDFQLDARGPIEDQAYSLDPFLVKNIRRGNSVLEIMH